MPISSAELVALALEISGMERLPADSCVLVPGEAMTRIMFGIDIGTSELQLAKSLGCDGVIAHHPAGGSAIRHFAEVLTRQIQLYGRARRPSRHGTHSGSATHLAQHHEPRSLRQC